MVTSRIDARDFKVECESPASEYGRATVDFVPQQGSIDLAPARTTFGAKTVMVTVPYEKSGSELVAWNVKLVSPPNSGHQRMANSINWCSVASASARSFLFSVRNQIVAIVNNPSQRISANCVRPTVRSAGGDIFLDGASRKDGVHPRTNAIID